MSALRRLVLGASPDLAAALADLDLDLTRDPQANYDVIVEVLPPADSPSRRAADLARLRLDAIAAAPTRWNAVLSGAPNATAKTVRWLISAPAVTGQVLAAEPEQGRP